MKKMSQWIMIAGLCMMMAGCGSSGVSQSVNTDMAVQEEAERETSTEDRENETIVESKTMWTKEMQDEEIAFLEDHFSDGMEFEDMDESMAVTYGKDISEYYDLIGRITEDGCGYVLAFRKDSVDIFEGYDQYWKDQDFVVVDRNEETDQENIIYSFSEINDICTSSENDILYIQPEDLEVPGELKKAFILKYCSGEEGIAYLEDVMERGVRFTPPDEDGYLEVYRYENGKQRLEYVSLTKEEEKAIIHSDALIMPEWYGEYGLQYFVSQDIYEETDMEEGPITEEALKIAEERCRFVAMDISEIHDIVEAKFEMQVNLEDGSEKQIEIDVQDPDVLMELEEILASSFETGEGKCPYTGILTLTREDGLEMVLSLATDGCDGFIFGSNSVYTVGKEKTARIWEIFSDAREYTGWTSEE